MHLLFSREARVGKTSRGQTQHLLIREVLDFFGLGHSRDLVDFISTGPPVRLEVSDGNLVIIIYIKYDYLNPQVFSWKCWFSFLNTPVFQFSWKFGSMDS